MEFSTGKLKLETFKTQFLHNLPRVEQRQISGHKPFQGTFDLPTPMPNSFGLFGLSDIGFFFERITLQVLQNF